ncbi:MAG: Rho termination factor [Actinomycetota bacterium]
MEAAAAAKRTRTIANLPKATRRALSRNAAAARRRGGKPGRSLEDRTRAQLYEQAKKRNIAGASMGKSELIDALRAR